MSQTLTPSALVAQIVSEVCVPMIAGQKSGQAAIEGVWLSEEQRRDECGLTGQGRTAVYQLDGVSVFLDLAANRSMLWFQHKDARNAMAAVEAAMKRVNSTFRQTNDAPRSTPGMRTRVCIADVTAERLAQVEFAYMAPGAAPADDDRFKVSVFAYSRIDAPEGRPPEPAPPVAPTTKKKGWLN